MIEIVGIYAISVAGIKMQKILNTLDALDSHNFERIDQNNSIDTLYNSIFPPIPEKQASSSSSNVNSTTRFMNKANTTGVNNQAEDKKDYVSSFTEL